MYKGIGTTAHQPCSPQLALAIPRLQQPFICMYIHTVVERRQRLLTQIPSPEYNTFATPRGACRI